MSGLPRELEKVAVFRALHLGDLMCAIPAMRAMKNAYPHVEITLIGLPSTAAIAQRYSRYIDGFTSFPGIPGLPEQDFDANAFAYFLQRERDSNYDLVLQMHGNGSVTNPLICMLGAECVAGFYQEGAFCPDSQNFMPYPEDLPEIQRHLSLMKFLGIEANGAALEFPIFNEDLRAFEQLRREYGIKNDYVCVHPGARDIRRWWAPRKFAQVADVLAGKGYDVVFTGTDAEYEAVERVRGNMREKSINLAGRTSLGVLGALVHNSRLVVSNDTGVSHVAAALGTPSVVIFLASDPTRWAPLNRALHQVVLPEEADDVDGVVCHAERALKLPRHEQTMKFAL